MHILFACCRFSGEGHDIITPDDMLVTINSNGGIKGVVASVVSVDQKQEFKTKTKVPNISLMNNITFLLKGVIFRKAYGIGNDYLMPNNLFKDNVTMRGFEVHMIRYYIGVVNLYCCCHEKLYPSM